MTDFLFILLFFGETNAASPSVSYVYMHISARLHRDERVSVKLQSYRIQCTHLSILL